MSFRDWCVRLGRGCAVVVPLVLLLAGASGNSAQAPTPPVVSLKSFVDFDKWQVDVTWSAQDACEDDTWSAQIDMTATAQYILKLGDKKDAWGRWHVEAPKSGNLAFSAFLINKHSHSRDSYQNSSASGLTGATNFQVGGNTPSYQLDCLTVFPARLTSSSLGTLETRVALNTMDTLRGPAGFCTGPLPASGQTIHGSTTFQVNSIAPFVPPLRPTRVGIQYVIQPLVNLAPLAPSKKK